MLEIGKRKLLAHNTMAKGTKEIHFEEHIENYLTTIDKYNSIDAKDYDKDLLSIAKSSINLLRKVNQINIRH